MGQLAERDHSSLGMGPDSIVTDLRYPGEQKPSVLEMRLQTRTRGRSPQGVPDYCQLPHDCRMLEGRKAVPTLLRGSCLSPDGWPGDNS